MKHVSMHILRVFICVFCSVFISQGLVAQSIEDRLPDSLRMHYSSLRHDTARIRFITDFVQDQYLSDPNRCIQLLKETNNISQKNDGFAGNIISNQYAISYYQLSQWDSVEYYSLRALSLTDSLKEPRFYGRVLNTLSNTMRVLSRHEEADDYRMRARASHALANDTLGLAIIDNDLGLHYFNLGLYSRSLDHYQKALDGLRQVGHAGGEAIVMNNIGMIIHQQKDYSQARAYYLKSYAIGAQIQSKDHMASTLNNIGSSYQDEGLLDSALHYLALSLEIKQSVEDYGRMAGTFNNYGIIYAKKGNTQKAIDNHLKAISYAQTGQDKVTEADARIRLGQVYLTTGQREAAISALKKGLALAQQTESLQLQQEAHHILFEVFKKYDPSEALMHLEQSALMKDSLLNEDKVRALTIKEKEYEFEQEKLAKEKEIVLLNAMGEVQQLRLERSHRNITMLTAGLLFLSLFTALMYYNRQRIKSLNNDLISQTNLLEKALKEKEVLLREIHHRVKNNLQVISSLLKLQSRHVNDETTQKVLAEGQNRVRSMALIHQNLYQDDNLSAIHMPAYLNQLCHELINNYNTSDSTVQVDIDVEDIHLDVDTVVPIGLIVNELITNTLKYAFIGVGHPAISITLREKPEGLDLSVKDNGTGMDSDKQISDGLGMRLIHSFAQRLNADVTFTSEQGTEARFIIRDYKTVTGQ